MTTFRAGGFKSNTEQDFDGRLLTFICFILINRLDDYVKWHQVQRRFNLNKPETKFLTVACHQNRFCGGISGELLIYFQLFFLCLTMDPNSLLCSKLI